MIFGISKKKIVYVSKWYPYFPWSRFIKTCKTSHRVSSVKALKKCKISGIPVQHREWKGIGDSFPFHTPNTNLLLIRKNWPQKCSYVNKWPCLCSGKWFIFQGTNSSWQGFLVQIRKNLLWFWCNLETYWVFKYEHIGFPISSWSRCSQLFYVIFKASFYTAIRKTTPSAVFMLVKKYCSKIRSKYCLRVQLAWKINIWIKTAPSI